LLTIRIQLEQKDYDWIENEHVKGRLHDGKGPNFLCV